MTLEELVLCVLNKSNNNSVNIDPNKNNDTVYTIEQVIDNYSFFTRYSLNKAIVEENLPYFKIGNKKYFKKSEIENWINNQKDYKF